METSPAIAVNVSPTPATPIISVGGTTTFCNGGAVSLSVATVAGLTYLWKKNGGGIGANLPTYSAFEQGTYTIDVKNGSNCIATSSNSVDVYVLALPTTPTINLSGAAQFCNGGSVTLSVTNNPSYTYLWKKDGGSTGGSSNSYSATTSGTYTLQVTNSSNNCVVETTPAIAVNVLSIPAVPTIQVGGSTTFCSGGSVGLSVPVTAGLSYQWKLNSGNTGTNSSVYSANATGSYTLNVTNANNCTVSSGNSISVNVLPLPNTPSINKSSSTEFCEGGSVSLSVTNNPAHSYVWKKNNGLTSNISNSFTVTQSGNYSLLVTDLNLCFVETSPVNVNVLSIPVPPLIEKAGSTTFCNGKSVILSTTAQSNITYQWYRDAVPYGANSASLEATTAGTYTLKALNPSCATMSSNSVSVNVLSLPVVPSVSLAGTPPFCMGTSVSLSVPLNNSYTYQWKRDAFDLENKNTNFCVAQASGNYSVQITDVNGCISESALENISFVASPAVPNILASGNTSFCQGGNVVLSVSEFAGYTYQWKLNGGVVGTNHANYTASNSGNYSIDVKNENNCSASSSNSLAVEVFSLPDLPSVDKSGATVFCENGSVSLSVINNARYTYQWRVDGNLTGITEPNFLAKASGNYTLKIFNENNCWVETPPITVSVKAIPDAPVISVSGLTVICEGQSTQLSVQAQTGYSYQWLVNGSNTGISDDNISVKSAGKYQMKLTNSDNCINLSSNSIDVVVLKSPVIASLDLESTPEICESDSIKLSVAYDSYHKYQWKLDGQALTGQNKNFMMAKKKGIYSVEVSNGACGTESPKQSISYKSKVPKPDLFIRGPVVWYFGCSNMYATQYQWYKDGVLIPDAKEHIFVANQNLGCYQVKISDGGECWVASEVVCTEKTNLKNQQLSIINYKLLIHPNPAANSFRFSFTNDYVGKYIVKLMDGFGKSVLEKTFNKSEPITGEELMVNVPSGVYVLEITFDGKVIKEKVVIQ